jgi:hypothetical protein
MKLRKGLIVTGIVLALTVPTTAFAATSNSTAAVRIRGLFGINSSNLTTTQQADVNNYAQKMADLQKSFLDTLVSDGAITQAQADTQKAQIDSKLASGDIDFGGFGRTGERSGVDTSKLTDAQKTTLLSLKKDQLTLRNDLAVLLVEQKLITQVQADTIKQNVDAAIAALTDSTKTHGLMDGYMGEFNMLQGVTLTDTQKTALLEWTAKYADNEKKIVALYKDAGAITQAQADTMNAQIDSRASDPLSFISNDKGGKGFDKMDGGKVGGRHGH